MAPSGKQPAVRAGREAWRKLGAKLTERRAELGYQHRPAFAAERLPLTPDGNINTRLVVDAEKGYRGTYQLPTLKQLALGYAVTLASVIALLRGEADELEPAGPGQARPAGPLPGPDAAERQPPMTDPARAAAAIPYERAIWERIAGYITRHPGTAAGDIPGRDLFGADPVAGTWDDPRLRQDWPVGDRVWMCADLQARRAARENRAGGQRAPA